MIDYAEPIPQGGLVFMDTPGFDPASVTDWSPEVPKSWPLPRGEGVALAASQHLPEN